MVKRLALQRDGIDINSKANMAANFINFIFPPVKPTLDIL
jgi:hypothetical protein